MRRTPGHVSRDARGVVMAEFLVAIFPVMIAFLGFTQFCFMGIAKLAVRHSAVLAARAAVVVIEEADGIPGAPVNIYGGFPAGGLEINNPNPNASSNKQGSAAGIAASQNEIGGVSQVASNSGSTRQTMDGLLGSYERTSTRMKQIRTAAYWPLLAISPSMVDDGMDIGSALSSGELFPKMRVKNAIGKSDSTRILGSFLYNLGAVAVSFPTGFGSAQLRTSGEFEKPDQLVTTRVSYLFRCQVPFVSWVMCASGWSLMFGDAWVDPFLIRRVVKTVGEPPRRVQDMPEWVDDWKRTQAMHDQLQKRVDSFGGRKLEFEQVEWPFMLDVLLAWPGSRYIVLSAEAELPLQGANYYPRVNTKDMEYMSSRKTQQQSQGTALPNLRENLTPIGDGVKQAAQAVSEGMEKVSAGVDKIRGLRDEYLGQLQTDAQGYVTDLQSQTSGYLGGLQGAFDQYSSDLGATAGKLGSSVGSAVGGPLADVFGGNLKNQANSGAKQVLSSSLGFANNVRDEAGELGDSLKEQAKGLGSDALREARSGATTLAKAGNGYAQDVKNMGKEGADAIKQTGAGFANELAGGNPLASLGGGSAPSSSSSRRGTPARGLNPAAQGAAPGSSSEAPAQGSQPAAQPPESSRTPTLGLDEF